MLISMLNVINKLLEFAFDKCLDVHQVDSDYTCDKQL